MTADGLTSLVSGVQNRDTRSIARACRLIDERDPRSIELLRRIFSHDGHAFVIGVTGTPGAGKSTVVDGLIQLYREAGRSVGVLAIDPSSPYTGGAILGDRIRMQRHFLDEAVFIRSIATRGHLGGLSRSTGDVLQVLHAAKFDVVILETVGVGQDELEVTRLADTTLVVVAPGLGDDVQAIKAGILEIADLFAVNKADRPGADAAVQDLQQMLSLRRAPQNLSKTRGHTGMAALNEAPSKDSGQWVPPILRTVATKGEGLAELVQAMSEHRAFLASTEAGREAAARRKTSEFREILHQRLLDALEERFAEDVSSALSEVLEGSEDPYSAAEALVRRVLNEENEA